MNNNYVKFMRGTPEAYASLKVKDNNTLYFISETDALTGKLYLGAKEIICDNNVDVKITLEDLDDISLGDPSLLKDGDVLSFNADLGIWEARAIDAVPEVDNVTIKIIDGKLSAILPEVEAYVGDDASINIVDNVASLYNYGKAFYKYIEATDEQPATYKKVVVGEADEAGVVYTWKAGLIPQVTLDEETQTYVLGWYEPNPTTIEGINNQVAALQTTVDALEDKVSKVYTKEETEAAIAAKVADANHLKYKVIESTSDIDFEDADVDQYIYMVANDSESYDEYMVLTIDGEKVLNKVGDWKVDLSDYVSNEALEEALNAKVDAKEGYSLMSQEQAEKLEGIEAGAQKNLFTAVNATDFSIVDGTLNLNTIEVTKVEGLSDALSTLTSLEKIVVGHIDENGEEVPGLQEEVALLKQTVGTLGDTFVTIERHENDLEAILEKLKWQEIVIEE